MRVRVLLAAVRFEVATSEERLRDPGLPQVCIPAGASIGGNAATRQFFLDWVELDEVDLMRLVRGEARLVVEQRQRRGGRDHARSDSSHVLARLEPASAG